MLRDWRVALRGIVRHWPFSISAILALSIALSTAGIVLGVGDAVLFQQLLPEGADSDRVVRLFTSRSDGTGFGGMSRADLFDVEELSLSIDRAAWSYKSLVSARAGDNPSRSLLVEDVSHDYFPLLGVRLRVDDDPEDVVVVLGRSYSRLLFGEGNSAGRDVVVDGRSYRVADVAPADFRGLTPGMVPSLWRVHPRRELSPESSRASRFLDVIGELSSETSVDMAGAELRSLSDALALRYPDTNSGRRITPVPLSRSRFNPEADEQLWRFSALVMLGSGLFVLLVCLNLGGFVFARAEGKRSTISTQLALGGTRIDVIRVPFWEAVILSAAAVCFALVVSAWMLPTLLGLAFPSMPLGLAGGMSPRVVVGLWTLGGLAAATYGVVPYVLASGRGAPTGTTTLTGRTPSSRVSRAAVTTQTWVAVVLLATATMLVESVAFRQYLDLGFQTEGLTLAQISIAGRSAEDYSAVDRAAAQFAERSVAQSDWLPLTAGTQTVTVRSTGSSSEDGAEAIRASVSPNFFATMGMSFERGGTFREQADTTGPAEMVVTAELARRLGLAPDNMIGALVSLPGHDPNRSRTVVGVIGDHKARDVSESAAAVAYFPLFPGAGAVRNLVAPTTHLRPSSELRSFAASTEGLSLGHIRTIEDHVRQSMAGPRSLATSFLSMAFVATCLVGLGVFGLTSLAVQRRRREIGIRAALGASPPRLALAIVAPECRPLVLGLVIGFAVTVGVHFVFRDFFPGASLYDFRLLASCVVPPSVAALLALLPAARSSRESPALSLPRSD